jgi:hypothetical protein
MYSSPSIALGGAFATYPGFTAKLNKSWSNITKSATRDYSTMTINFAQFAPGTDLAAAVADDSSKISATLSTPEKVGEDTIWTGTSTNANAQWTIAYVAKGDAIARAVCLQYGTEKGSVTCPAANVRALAQSVIDTPAPTALAETASVASLIPATPAQLTPELLNIEPALPLWAENVPGESLDRALAARKNSVSLQYAVVGQPQLIVKLKVGALTTEAPARPFVSTICQSSVETTRACKLTRIPKPAYGYIGTWSAEDKPAVVDHLAMHFVGGRKLGDASCGRLGPQTDGLNSAEIAACRSALVRLATATVK